MNVLAQPDVPQVGIAVDSYTAATITDGKTLGNVGGLYSIGILDAETLGAAENATYENDILSMHNVVFHILPPGDFSYDLETREMSIAPTSTMAKPALENLKAIGGAGALIPVDDLFNADAFDPMRWMSNHPALIDFVDFVGKKPLLVVVYAPDNSGVGTLYGQALQELPMGGADLVYPLSRDPALESMFARVDVTQYAGILVVTDGERVPDATQLVPVKAAWQAGTPLLLGNAAADLAQTFFTAQAAPVIDVNRSFDDLRTPAGAGTLIVTGSLHAPFENNAILGRFVELAGGADANILAVYDGFADSQMMADTAPYFEAGLASFGVTQIKTWDVSGDAPESFDAYTGILFVGNDATLMHPDQLAPLKDAWLAGVPILADWTASSVLGVYYAAHGQTPLATDEEPFADIDFIQGAFINGNTDIQAGLGLLNITIETRTLADYRVGRLVSLAYAHPDLLAIGLNEETALEINADGATVLGSNGVFVLDLRQATLDLGTNDAYAIANGLLDSFAPGENVVVGG
jgi:cyanophycinase